jgi:Domain of unknown function (DUF5076)
MSERGGHPIYDALALPNEALEKGGAEILRAGIIADDLYVSARRAFKDPAQWGEVLADITRRLGLLYSAETDFSERQVIAAIESAYAADLGARPARGKQKTKRKNARGAKTSGKRTRSRRHKG